MVKVSPTASWWGPSAKRPRRILGPWRSASTEMALPVSAANAAHGVEPSLVVGHVTVAHVQTSHVHAGLGQLEQGLVGVDSGPEGTDDLGSTHGSTLSTALPLPHPSPVSVRRRSRERTTKGARHVAGPLRGAVRRRSDDDRARVRRDRRRQRGAAGQVRVDARGGRATLRDGPHDERLAPAAVTGDEDAVDARTCTACRA